MKPLDLNTLLYIVGAISLLFGLLMMLYYKRTPTIKGPLYWAMGNFSVVIGAFLFAGYPYVSGYLAFVIGGTLTVMSISFCLAGIQLFCDKKINQFYFYGLIVAEFFASTFFYLVVPSPQLRMSTFSLICFVGSVIVILQLLKPAQKEYRLPYLLISVVFGISALTSLYRAVAVLILRPEEAHVPISANLLFYFMSNLTQVLLMFSFLFLISIRIVERLEQKVRDQRKFYSIISHDLNGPVGMMNAMLSMANNDVEMEEKKRRQIYAEVENLGISTSHLLQNLLHWSRSQLENLNPNLRNIDLNRIILENIELLHQLARSKNIEVVYKPEAHLNCYADRRMIDTVIRNLISNAIKFSPSGGEIVITVEKAAMLSVRVKDYGVGMSDQELENLFVFRDNETPRGTAGEKGTGLGLILCKEFVDANNGLITVESKTGTGTEVTVRLPVA